MGMADPRDCLDRGYETAENAELPAAVEDRIPMSRRLTSSEEEFDVEEPGGRW
jgi:hypothetical protein